ncbi:MAG: hypothetical protein CME26_09095 [Gemmatimonadetes bacterium]|nr:hypothetical protein [Gemmatimonadota bacterium]
MNASNLPTLNAALNALSAFLLIMGYREILRGERDRHRKWMIGALATSILFLISYLIYHWQVGSVPYPHHDWTRPVYFAILIPHIILAAVNVPLVLIVVRRAWRGDFERHRALAKWVWPSWIFVCVSGVAIYLMLYHL